MIRGRIAALAVALALGVPAAASAQQEGLTQPADRMGTSMTVERSAAYPGVVPGRGNSPPRARAVARSRHNLVTWPGFEMTSGGSRIFVQTTRPVTYQRADEPNRIILRLEGARIHLRNNRNPLVTEHFNTPVARAFLRRERGATVLVLEMKVLAEPRIHQSSEGEYHFLFLEFPGGEYPVPAGSVPSQVRYEADRDSGSIRVRSVD